MQIDFNDFVNELKVQLQLTLPGSLAHETLRALPADKTNLKFDHKLPPKPGSVLILLYQEEGEIKFPLTKRATYKGTHSGQISLPGGKRELGETDIDAALRECEEEIGINRNEIKIIGRLTDFFVIPSNFIVAPIVGYIPFKPTYKADPVEVDTIIKGTVLTLLEETSLKKKEIVVGNNIKLVAPHFEIEQEIVWGATAMILNEFRMVAIQTIKTLGY